MLQSKILNPRLGAAEEVCFDLTVGRDHFGWFFLCVTVSLVTVRLALVASVSTPLSLSVLKNVGLAPTWRFPPSLPLTPSYPQ